MDTKRPLLTTFRLLLLAALFYGAAFGSREIAPVCIVLVSLGAIFEVGFWVSLFSD